MPDDPFLQLVCDALGLMNPAFTDPQVGFLYSYEFYHQFRKLWDRGIPVGMGLGHLIVRYSLWADIAVYRLGEGGRQDEPLAGIRFSHPTGLEKVADGTATVLSTPHNFRYAIVILYGRRDPLPPLPAGVTLIQFDPECWTATVIGT
jgi:hypothetical protein